MFEKQEFRPSMYKRNMILLDNEFEGDNSFTIHRTENTEEFIKTSSRVNVTPEKLTTEDSLENFQELSAEVKALKKMIFKVRNDFLKDAGEKGETKWKLMNPLRSIPFLIRKPIFKIYAVIYSLNGGFSEDHKEFFFDLKNSIKKELETLSDHYMQLSEEELDDKTKVVTQDIISDINKTLESINTIEEAITIKKEQQDKIKAVLSNGGRPKKFKIPANWGGFTPKR